MTKQFAHASGIMVLTPEGKMSRYFYGIEYNPRDLRLGLVEASDNKIGTPVDQMLLFCYHYDPATGKYGLDVMNILRLSAGRHRADAGHVHVRDAAAGADGGRLEMPQQIFTLFPPKPRRAGAAEVDPLYIFLIACRVVMTVLIFAAVFVFAIKYRRQSRRRSPAADPRLLRLEIAWSVIPFLVMLVMFVWGAKSTSTNTRPPTDAIGHLRRRQAVDVEGAVSGRPARDQRTARARGPAGAADHGVRRRDPQLLHSGVPREARRGSRATTTTLVHRDQARPLSSVLRRILRHRTSGHDRMGDRDGARRLSRTGCPAAARKAPWRRRARSCSSRWAAAPAICWTSRAAARSCAACMARACCCEDGRTVLADDAYIRESILNPNAKIVAGFKPDVMPTFQGQISEEGISAIDRIHQIAGDQEDGLIGDAANRQRTAHGPASADAGRPATRNRAGHRRATESTGRKQLTVRQ